VAVSLRDAIAENSRKFDGSVRKDAMRWSFLFVTLVLFGCDKLDAELPALSLTVPRVTSQAISNNKLTSERVARDRSVTAQGLIELRARLTFTPPSGQSLGSCQGRLSQKAEDSSLALSFVDARTTTKNLLPRRVSERLESGNVAELLGETDAIETKSVDELRILAAKLATWEQRRYVGVFFVTDYQGPALIVRVGERTRSWFSGRLAANFALIDTVERRPVCGYVLQVENDVSDAPIRSRLQAETRAKLERELGRSLAGAASLLLARDLPGLKLPETLALSGKPVGV
jgi:hypothetical protein